MRRILLIATLAVAAALPCRAQEHKHGPVPENESNSEYFMRISDEAFHRGDYEQAVLCHKVRVTLDPQEIDSYSIGAWLLWSMGRGKESGEFLEQGIKANPDDWEMWSDAGQQYDLQKKILRALECYTRAVALIPKEENSQMLRRRLAHAADKAGDFKLSVETWRGLVKDFPNDAVNKNNLKRVELLLAEVQNLKPAAQK